MGSNPGPSAFAGKFDGLGHTITGLTINRPNQSFVGLFGVIQGASVSNVGLLGGSIIGQYHVGGLMGANDNSIINNAYATGSVTGTGYVGGLVGYNGGTITNTYATGNVKGTTTVGGLVGQNFSTSNSFWNTQTQTHGITATVGLNGGTVTNSTGKTTAQLQQLATFSGAGWNIANTGGSTAIWRIYEGSTTPLLRSFLKPLPVYPDGTYAITGVDATHVFGSGTGIYSDQQGYDISFVPALPVVIPPVVIPSDDVIHPVVIVIPSDDIIPEKKQELVLVKPVIQVNLNFTTPLQVSTTFLEQYHERHAHHDDYVDADYGQYKNDDNASTTANYATLLISTDGIKLPDGLLKRIDSESNTF